MNIGIYEYNSGIGNYFQSMTLQTVKEQIKRFDHKSLYLIRKHHVQK